MAKRRKAIKLFDFLNKFGIPASESLLIVSKIIIFSKLSFEGHCLSGKEYNYLKKNYSIVI